jgi:hypothetical protein
VAFATSMPQVAHFIPLIDDPLFLRLAPSSSGTVEQVVDWMVESTKVLKSNDWSFQLW